MEKVGATCRISRRLGGIDLDFKTRPLESKCNLKKRPGQHGERRQRETEYGLQTAAKQALRAKYGVLERPFRRLFAKAARAKGASGVNLLQLLESRLDNVVYRMGFAATRREARQIVSHGGIMLNGQRVNIPSCQVKIGDEVSVHEKSKEQTRILEAVKRVEENGFVEWVEVDPKKLNGTFKRLPERTDLPSDINEQLVVELYSK